MMVNKIFQCIKFLIITLSLVNGNLVIHDEILDETLNLYTIEGKIYPPEDVFISAKFRLNEPKKISTKNFTESKWLIDTTVSINGDEYKGFLRQDGSFIISGVPSGSYVVEVNNPDYSYEPVRVEINPKGKFRARHVNYIQPAHIVQLPYPLKMRVWFKYKYFQKREQWKITDFLLNPMVLMMILPVFLLCILPKMINDPETKKELENMQLPKISNDMPEISEMFTSLFASGAKLPEKKALNMNKQTRKRN